MRHVNLPYRSSGLGPVFECFSSLGEIFSPGVDASCWQCLSKQRTVALFVLRCSAPSLWRCARTAVGRRRGTRVLAGASIPGSSTLHAARLTSRLRPSAYRLRGRRCRCRRRPRPPPRRQSAISSAPRSTRWCESARRQLWPCLWRFPRARRRTGPPLAGRSFPCFLGGRRKRERGGDDAFGCRQRRRPFLSRPPGSLSLAARSAGQRGLERTCSRRSVLCRSDLCRRARSLSCHPLAALQLFLSSLGISGESSRTENFLFSALAHTTSAVLRLLRERKQSPPHTHCSCSFLFFSPQARGLSTGSCSLFALQQQLLLESIYGKKERAPAYKTSGLVPNSAAATRKKERAQMDSARLVLDKVQNDSYAHLIFLLSVRAFTAHHKLRYKWLACQFDASKDSQSDDKRGRQKSSHMSTDETKLKKRKTHQISPSLPLNNNDKRQENNAASSDAPGFKRTWDQFKAAGDGTATAKGAAGAGGGAISPTRKRNPLSAATTAGGANGVAVTSHAASFAAGSTPGGGAFVLPPLSRVKGEESVKVRERGRG